MADTKTFEKLDSLLRMYFNSATTDGEKSNALQLFKKISVKNGVNPDEYIKKSPGNPVNERRGRFNRPNSRSNSRQSSGFDADDFWDEIFRNVRQKQQRDDANDYRRKYEQAEKQERERKAREEGKRREEERQRQEAKRQQDQTRRWGTNSWGTLEFEMKEPLWEVKFHNEKRVILLNTMVRGKGTQNRWGTQNFCIYSDTFNPEKWFTLKAKDSTSADPIYIVQSGKVQYFRDHYIMEKLFIIDSEGFEVEIPLK